MGDVTKADTLTKAFEGVESIVIVSSAMPQLNFWSLPGTIFRKMVGNKTAKPDFYYAPGGGASLANRMQRGCSTPLHRAVGLALSVEINRVP